MPITTFYAAKGGQGCSVTAAAYALALAERADIDPVHLIAADGTDDLAAVLGLPPCEYHGATVKPGLILSIGSESPWRVAESAADAGRTVVVDAGHHAGPAELERHGFRSVLVTRSCYLALRRAVTLPRPAAAVVILEAGRSLNLADVTAVTGAPAVGIDYSPAVARAVDAGLLAARTPTALVKSLALLDAVADAVEVVA